MFQLLNLSVTVQWAYRDLTNDNDVKIVLNGLSESVAMRMREQGFNCKAVCINHNRTPAVLEKNNIMEWIFDNAEISHVLTQMQPMLHRV